MSKPNNRAKTAQSKLYKILPWTIVVFLILTVAGTTLWNLSPLQTTSAAAVEPCLPFPIDWWLLPRRNASKATSQTRW